MSRFLFAAPLLSITVTVQSATAQSVEPSIVEPSIQLVASAGRSLHLALDKRISVKRAGQPVTATLLAPLYVYDRSVLPAGTKVVGHVDAIQHAPRRVHTRALLAGDFTPPRQVSLRFDALVLSDGRTIPIQALATEGAENVTMSLADSPEKTGVGARAREEIAREVRDIRDAVSVVKAPDKWERIKVAAIRSLPYHPHLLAKGTVYSAELLAPIDFGVASPAPRAAAGARPAPGSVLSAQLLTPISSATSARGSPVQAVLTRPVFSDEGAVILPEGARLTGVVTLATPARRFRRNGQLRFLIEGVQTPDRQPEPLVASLVGIESSTGDRVSVDEEGGIGSTSSKMRFAAPGLAALALVGATHGRPDFDTDTAGVAEMHYGGAASGTVGGFIGLGAIGVAVNSLGRYVTVATTVFGLSRTVYTTVFAKGREVAFPKDTSILVQLAPGRDRSKNEQEPP